MRDLCKVLSGHPTPHPSILARAPQNPHGEERSEGTRLEPWGFGQALTRGSNSDPSCFETRLFEAPSA